MKLVLLYKWGPIVLGGKDGHKFHQIYVWKQIFILEEKQMCYVALRGRISNLHFGHIKRLQPRQSLASHSSKE